MNGSPTGIFANSCGLYQGNLLSPLILILIMDALSRMLDITVHHNFLSNFKVGDAYEIIIFHLLFANDTLIFNDLDKGNLCNFKALLFFFEAISDFKINLSKS